MTSAAKASSTAGGGAPPPRREIARQAQAAYQVHQTAAQGRAVVDRLLELGAAPVEEPEADVTARAGGCEAGALQRGPGDVDLLLAGAAGQILDGRTVEVAGREVEGEVALVGAQFLLDEADRFEPVLPVHVGDQPQAGEDIAHGDDRGRLAVRLGDHQRLALAGVDPRLQPLADLGVLEASEALQQAGGEGPAREPLRGEEVRGEPVGRVESEQPVGGRVRGRAVAPGGDDEVGDPAQVLHQQQAQGDGDRPQLAEGQGLAGFVGAHIAREQIGFDEAVGVGDETPHQGEDARVAREETGPEFGQFPEVVGGEVETDLAHVGLDGVEVVEEPFGRRRDLPSLLDVVGDGFVGLGQRGHVRPEPGQEGHDPLGVLGDRMAVGQGAGVVLEPLGREDLGANGLGVAPRRAGPAAQPRGPGPRHATSPVDSHRRRQRPGGRDGPDAPVPVARESRGTRRASLPIQASAGRAPPASPAGVN
ncbi:hypothetical protein [Nostocoides australiense]|uniref:hypothetical protein n=1 Tax=Nostocoides australiense TaxID=99480 RepID=UPI000B182CA5|nr:hypothetical protein [Tetrasphaera australiensis]